MSRKILFFGNERLASGVTTTTPVLRALINAGYEITGVVVAQNAAGASRKTRELEIETVARQYNIPVFAPAKLGDAHGELATLGADLGVLVAFGKIVPQATIDLLPHGIINIHPSLLPKHRGPTPIESVILNGEAETGVSLMQLSAGMDSGPIFAQEHLALRGDETKFELTGTLLELGKTMLINVLPGIIDGSVEPQPQAETGVTYDTKLSKAMSVLDWQKPAVQLAREVRALAGWPRSRASINGVDVTVTQAHAEAGTGKPGERWQVNKQLGLYTSDGIFVIDSLLPAGKKDMSGAAFLAGYSKR